MQIDSETMIDIALIHLAWLMLAPIGAVILLIYYRRRKKRGIIAGALILAASLPAILFCGFMWPFDYLIPGSETRLPVTAGKYQIALIQQPGSDFYNTIFEIKRNDGKITRVWVDSDDRKWWAPRIVKQGSRIYFVHGVGKIDKKTSFYDSSGDLLCSAYLGRTHKIADLNFDKPWNDEPWAIKPN